MAVDNKVQFPSELLKRLHSLHTQLADLEGQLQRLPRQIVAGDNIVGEATTALDAAKQAVKSSTMACDEKQLQLKTREDRIEDLKAKLNSAASNKEFNLLKEQIAADKQANSVQSDEILEGLERIDQLSDEAKAADAELAKKTKEQKERTEKIEGRIEVIKSDLEYVRNELDKSEKDVPGAVKSEYMRLSKSRGEECLAPIEDDSCGGCNQTLTTQIVDRVRLQFLVHCPACQAWLYHT